MLLWVMSSLVNIIVILVQAFTFLKFCVLLDLGHGFAHLKFIIGNLLEDVYFCLHFGICLNLIPLSMAIRIV